MPSDNLLAAVRESARNHPDDSALIFRDKHIGYRELAATAADLTKQLGAIDIGARRLLCVPATKNPETIALVLACVDSRIPVLLPSAELGGDGLRALARRAGCSQIVAAIPDGDGRVALAAEPLCRTDSDEPVLGPPRLNVALLLTTSGSTGMPKVVPIPQHAVDRFTDWAAAQFDIRRGTRVLSYAPLNFDLSLLDVWVTLARGGCAVLVDPKRATDASYLLDLCAARAVTVVQSVPMFYRLLTEAAQRTGTRPPAAAHVLFTGDNMPPSLLRRTAEVFPNARLYNVFGCTETNDSLMHEVDRSTLAPALRLPLGTPLPDVDAVIVDADGAVVHGPGSGELLVRTPFQTEGYLDAALDEGRFVAHPDGVNPGRYYRTGDLVTRVAGGEVLLEGRNDFHVKVRGVRTNTQEVERVILAHPDVREAAVVAVPDELAGARLYALVQREPGGNLNSLRLRTHCALSLPRTAIPSSISIIDSPIPRTPTGKPDRSRITAAHLIAP